MFLSKQYSHIGPNASHVAPIFGRLARAEPSPPRIRALDDTMRVVHLVRDNRLESLLSWLDHKRKPVWRHVITPTMLGRHVHALSTAARAVRAAARREGVALLEVSYEVERICGRNKRSPLSCMLRLSHSCLVHRLSLPKQRRPQQYYRRGLSA